MLDSFQGARLHCSFLCCGAACPGPATGGEVGGDTPEQFQAFTLAEYERWGKVIRDAGIKLE